MTKTKYTIYDATTGEHQYYDTKEQAVQAFWVSVISLAKSHYHDTAYMVVEQKDDGSEVWYNDNNQEIDNPKTADEILLLLDTQRRLTVEQQTKVVTLP